MARTFEEKLMFDSGLPVGVSLVKLVKGQAERLALVEITNRGKVYLIAKPGDGDMYSCWDAVQGNKLVGIKGGVVVWGSRDAKYMKQFDGDPVATIHL